MANSKISALTSAATVVGTEVLPIVQSSATVKVSVANLTPGLNTITAAKGGTGQTSYAVGDLLYANTTTTLAKLADVATGNALISGGVGVAPSYGKIGLTTHVSGTLPVANGGTNASSASITAFNNITGYTASGATGTTSTNLVFSTSPSLTTPNLGDATATKINSSEASTGSIANGATAVIFTLPQEGSYLVVVRQDGAGNGGIRAAAIVMQGSSTNGTSALFGVSCTLSSGSNFDVNLTNNAGGAATFRYSYTRLSS